MDQIEGYSYFLPLLGELEKEKGYVITATNKDFYELLHDLLKRFHKNYNEVATLSKKSAAENVIRSAVERVFSILWQIAYLMVQDIEKALREQTEQTKEWFNPYMISFFQRNGIDVERYKYEWEQLNEAQKRAKNNVFTFDRKSVTRSLVQNLDLNLRL